MIHDTDDNNKRWKEVSEIWNKYPGLSIFAGFLLGALVSPAFIYINDDFLELLQNLVPEAIGIAVTVLIIEELQRRRDKVREVKERKERLIRQVGSRSNPVALDAAHEIESLGLQSKDYSLLAGADLTDADLQGSMLRFSDFRRTEFWFTKLNEGNFYQSDATSANFWGSEMKNTNLRWCNFKDAIMIGVDLCGADLHGANLVGVKFYGYKTKKRNFVALPENANARWQYPSDVTEFYTPQFDEKTILPDGNNWSPDVDMTRFTWRQHPDFWRPDDIQVESDIPWWYKDS